MRCEVRFSGPSFGHLKVRFWTNLSDKSGTKVISAYFHSGLSNFCAQKLVLCVLVLAACCQPSFVNMALLESSEKGVFFKNTSFE